MEKFDLAEKTAPADGVNALSSGSSMLAAWVEYLALLLGLLAGQRFLLPAVSAYICLVPIAFALLNWRKATIRNALVCIALLSKVDSSDIAYMDTPGFVRMFIYCMAISILFAGFHISTRRLGILCGYVIVLLAMTLATAGLIDSYSLVRDVVTLIGLVAVLGAGRSSGERVVVDIRAVAFFSFGLLCSELINLWLFYDSSGGDYLSYDSLKGAVMFVPLYLLVSGRLTAFLPVFALSILVIIGYATRMLLITSVGILVLLLFSKATTGKAKATILGVLGAGIFTIALLLPPEFLEGRRMFGFLSAHENAAGWLEFVRVLDPVRYVEHEMFLQRSWAEIVFGSGLGSGLIDDTGQLSFVQPGTGAFSDTELLEARYFRLHDAWIYFGLRLGLVFVVAAYAFLANATLGKSRDVVILGGWGILLLNSATFSISGLLMTALVAKQIAISIGAGKYERGGGNGS